MGLPSHLYFYRAYHRRLTYNILRNIMSAELSIVNGYKYTTKGFLCQRIFKATPSPDK